MPVWNAVLGFAGAGFLFFKSFRALYFPAKLLQDSISVPKRYQEILHRTGEKLNVNTDKIEMYFRKGTASSAIGTHWMPKGGVLGLPERFGWKKKEVRMHLEGNLKAKVDLLSPQGRKVKNYFIPNEQKVSFAIAHELAHFKYNDQLKDGLRRGTWFYVTVYPLTDLFLDAAIVDVFDNPIFDQFIPPISVAFCWALSYELYQRVVIWINHRQEFRADHTAGQLSLKTAEGGIQNLTEYLEMIKTLRNYDEELKKVHSADGELLSSPSHPKYSERIKRLEAIVAQHKSKRANKSNNASAKKK